MRTRGIQFNANGRREPFFRTPNFRSSDHSWAGFSFEEAQGQGEPLPRHSWTKTTLLYVTGGVSSLRWKHRGIWSTDPIQRGTVSIVRRDVEIDSAVPSTSFPMMVMQLDNSKLHHLAPEQVLTIDKFLVSAQVTRDFRLAELLSAMGDEVKEGCISGRLYGESISLALLAYLAGRYATPQPVDGSKKCLSPAQKRSLVDYIRANVFSNISVMDLAGMVQMSPSHFARMFKSSFGATPYQFVMRERVEVAKGLFAYTQLTATQVAMELGFSSHSHFLKVFRQFTGITPKQYKAGT